MKRPLWRLTENKSASGWESPRFHIEYNGGSGPSTKQELSFRFLSLLRQDADMIIRVDSQLLCLPPKDRCDIVVKIIKEFESLGLEFRYRRFPGNNSSNFWFQLLRLDPGEAMEAMAYVPAKDWQRNLHSLMDYGTFYYICHSGVKGSEILDSLFNGGLQSLEPGNFIELMVFDSVLSGHMGIFTNKLELADIKELLMI